RSAADHETIRGRARTHVDAERSGSGSYVAAGKRKDTVRRTIAQVDQTAVGEAFQAGEGHGSLDAKRAAVDQQVGPSAELRCARSLESAGVGEGIVASCQVHPAAQRAAWPDRHRGWATVGVQCGPVAAGERVADGNGRAGARGDIDANLRSADGAPARVVTLTVQPLEAAIPVPAAEAIGPRAVTFTAAQPVAWALMPLLPGPETVIGPTRMVWSPRPVVTSIPFEPGPAVSIAPTPIVTGPSSPITIIPGESEPPVFTVPPPTLIGPVPSISTPGESSPPVSMTSKSTSIGPSPPSTTIAGESSPSVSTVPKSASTGPGVSMTAPGESSPSVSTSVPPGAPGVPPVGAPGPPGVPPSSLPMTTPQAPVPSVAQAVGSVMRVMAGAEAPSVLTASRSATICPGTSTSTPAARSPSVEMRGAVRLVSYLPRPRTTQAVGSPAMSTPVDPSPRVSSRPILAVVGPAARTRAPIDPAPPVVSSPTLNEVPQAPAPSSTQAPGSLDRSSPAESSPSVLSTPTEPSMSPTALTMAPGERAPPVIRLVTVNAVPQPPVPSAAQTVGSAERSRPAASSPPVCSASTATSMSPAATTRPPIEPNPSVVMLPTIASTSQLPAPSTAQAPTSLCKSKPSAWSPPGAQHARVEADVTGRADQRVGRARTECFDQVDVEHTGASQAHHFDAIGFDPDRAHVAGGDVHGPGGHVDAVSEIAGGRAGFVDDQDR